MENIDKLIVRWIYLRFRILTAITLKFFAIIELAIDWAQHQESNSEALG